MPKSKISRRELLEYGLLGIPISYGFLRTCDILRTTSLEDFKAQASKKSLEQVANECLERLKKPGNLTSFAISNIQDLRRLSEDVLRGYTDNEDVSRGYTDNQYVLTRDIDCKGESINPIGNGEIHMFFNGSFDGRGHTISNLRIKAYSSGLFGYIENLDLEKSYTIIANLNLKNIVSEGSEYSGLLFGKVCRSFFYNCNVSGYVNGCETNTGLLGGRLEHGVVLNCSGDGYVNGKHTNQLIKYAYNSLVR